MSIAAGTKLGRYEIRSKIGEGGMGEVYLAQDTQLDRAIALKILTAEVARDPQRLHRFLQEARAASALSHPNVAHIYEIGEGGGTHFIAMEYVEGAALDKKIAGRPLAISELVHIAVQVADALDEAHAKGVTHRDIKSSNIMITPRGRVKVLDFGLAKLSLPGGVTDRPSESEVATRVKTSPGVVMGTVNYMSPEQALGREVDHRSDIFSFGVVLYEMATGRLPFTGDTITETIDRIAHAQPEAIARLNYEVPAELEVVIKKALRKDRDERYQAIHDLLVDLKDLRRELDISERLEHSVAPSTRSAEVPAPTAANLSSSPTISSATTSPAPAAHPTSSAEYLVSEIKRHKTGAIIIVALAWLVLAAGSFGVYKIVTSRNQTTKPAAISISANMKIQRLTSNGKALTAAISPDGKVVVYVLRDGAQQSLWVRQVATNSNVQIVPPANVEYNRETFSPDGNYVYYVADDSTNPSGALYQVPSLGGSPRKILSDIDSPISFSPDVKRIAFIRNNEAATGEDQLIIANADGTSEQKLAARKIDEWFDSAGCGWSPDGRVIICPAGTYKGGFHETLIAVDAYSGAQKEFMTAEFSDAGRVSWLADNSGVVINAAERGALVEQLWLITYPAGEARKITNDLNQYFGTSFTADSRSLVTVQSDGIANVWLAPNGDIARAKEITSGKFEGNRGLAWTPDGRIVYSSLAGGNLDIWIMNSDGTGQRQLTNDPATDGEPAVSPDGRYIVFVSERRGFPSLWRMDLDGGNLKQLTDGQEDYQPQISRDGKWIFFSSWRSGRRTLWKISIEGGQPVQIIDKFVSGTSLSPDGKLIACHYKEEQPNSPWRIMIVSVEGGTPWKTFDAVSSVGEVSLNAAVGWMPDGRAIVYVDSAGGTPNLWSQSLDGGPPKKLTDFKENGVWRYAWSRDGKQLALTRGTTTNDVVLISDFR